RRVHGSRGVRRSERGCAREGLRRARLPGRPRGPPEGGGGGVRRRRRDAARRCRRARAGRSASPAVDPSPKRCVGSAPKMALLLSVREVTLRFGGIVALDGVSFDVSRGAVSGLIGPNGAGKTTGFHVIKQLYQ